jgi:hypothetical protein
VRAEAGRAKAEGKLIPVKTADVDYADIPLPFGEMHTENLGSSELIRAAVVAQLAKPAVEPTAIALLTKGLKYELLTWWGIIGGALTLFAAISSVFWRKTDTSRFDFRPTDLIPIPPAKNADFRSLPYSDSSLHVVVFDSPYSPGAHGSLSQFDNEYRNFTTNPVHEPRRYSQSLCAGHGGSEMSAGAERAVMDEV